MVVGVLPMCVCACSRCIYFWGDGFSERAWVAHARSMAEENIRTQMKSRPSGMISLDHHACMHASESASIVRLLMSVRVYEGQDK
jgi:hypothetical protein